MRKLLLVGFLAAGCAGSHAASNQLAGASGDAFHAEGIRLSRPSSWTFVATDATVAPDTLVILQGPAGAAAVSPVVEVARRKLSAIDQRKKPTSILGSMVAEMAQTFDGFETVGGPEDVTVADTSGARLALKYTEGMPDGSSVDRAARFYGLVRGDTLWVIRCIGPTDGSSDDAFDSILGSIAFDS
jgi:hypothetical protein